MSGSAMADSHARSEFGIGIQTGTNTPIAIQASTELAMLGGMSLDGGLYLGNTGGHNDMGFSVGTTFMDNWTVDFRHNKNDGANDADKTTDNQVLLGFVHQVDNGAMTIQAQTNLWSRSEVTSTKVKTVGKAFSTAILTVSHAFSI